MGNTVTTPDEQPPATEEEDTKYEWPNNLYEELRDLGEVSFLIYFFAYLLNAARASSTGNMELPELEQLREIVDADSTILMRKFTPQQIEQLVRAHEQELTDNPDFPVTTEQMLASLAELKKRVPSDKPQALTLVDYDDVYQQSELVYAIGKDEINKRVTLVLRGTDNKLAFGTNWKANLSVAKTKVPVPEPIQDYVDFDQVWIHSGFYNYAQQLTQTTKDAPETTKYSQVVAAVKKALQAAGPEYRLYVTGHSLGAAMSTVFSFLMMNEPDIPKPITCINFASPRVGDWNFLSAVEALEKHHLLRMLRVVNEGDSITVVPTFNFYHVGFQVKLFAPSASEGEDETKSPAPEISYPKISDAWWKRFGRAWDNSVVTSLNFSYDHSSYRERVLSSSEDLAKENLNDLYHHEEITGFNYIK